MRPTRAFTLIELLVVIAIIGLIASAALGTLQQTRLKAADSAVKEQVLAMRHVMELQFSDSGSYTAIKNGGGWKAVGATCASGFSGNHAASAQNVCAALVRATGNNCGTGCVYFGPLSIGGYPIGDPRRDPIDKFTIMAYLPYESIRAGGNRYMCVGSTGQISFPADPAPWNEPGCMSNP